MLDKVMQKDSSGTFTVVALPQYLCHKVVRAAKIVSTAFVAGEGIYRLALEGGLHVDVSKQWMQNKIPAVGGYYVQYDDGYASYSPAEAFDAGYTPVTAEDSTGKELAEEAQGSGSDKYGASDWTQAGDGTGYPNTQMNVAMKPSAEDLDAMAQEKAAQDATKHESLGERFEHAEKKVGDFVGELLRGGVRGGGLTGENASNDAECGGSYPVGRGSGPGDPISGGIDPLGSVQDPAASDSKSNTTETTE